MRGAIPPHPQYVFMAWCSVKHRDKFTFAFYLLATTRIKGGKKSGREDYIMYYRYISQRHENNFIWAG
jgi:hypothetical protein